MILLRGGMILVRTAGVYIQTSAVAMNTWYTYTVYEYVSCIVPVPCMLASGLIFRTTAAVHVLLNLCPTNTWYGAAVYMCTIYRYEAQDGVETKSAQLRHLYKRAIILLRTLYAFVRMIPAYQVNPATSLAPFDDACLVYGITVRSIYVLESRGCSQ